MVLEEKTISSDRVYTGKVITLKVDTVEIPGQGYQKRELVEVGGAVGIVAITDDNKVVLVKQFRKPIEKPIFEIPAGKLEKNESPKECAERELKEETGYSAKNIKLIHKFFTSAGFSNEIMFVYLATGLTPGENNLDADEFLDVYEVELEEAYNMVLKNDVEDAKTSIGLLLVKDMFKN
ncbi:MULTISPECIES: NUDIX hydrolase [Clostridioides]|uniref:NUDIX hydrolase n=1 Tax=unclassified Clostridioides TaxID=2635829 RepID=UPI001D0C66B8|nr:NUDIX hydrolase [Clostridioides sp. ZZV15-6388]MCC0637238.1 NUDIX hydrolase [Clostridioides sp. ES-S-0001-02]MCC0640501.1 NUDIX hydrolase [Clostridioides sp. ES-S-0049-03]MCC0644649.1 NUDIX hydrolase [Clostridioides sp. ZZV14-6150]MCC0650520.1 NUDIX hydrolase [Clostridioides sp. ZZV15-6598]MCC0651710.1 NUDIX hydrolase [Clostridioides sp. ES-S-0001-03]MCC0657518.1 NUDIX hydrolase [Clostridioides sp. ES-S-0123-01]MCC0659769.1 NUDIX hydrolase [Clostridioides sp. ZZV14-6154]MCC0664661.1 NUDI